MARWILGADRVEALDDNGIAVGARTRLTVSIGGAQRTGHTYVGEIVELTESRLVRRYCW